MTKHDTQKPGFWPSTLSSEAVAEGGLRFGRIQVSDGAVYWSEGRPAEQGRSAIMRWTEADGALELLRAPYSARSRVHEYGGGEFLVARGSLFFVNDSDQDIYVISIAQAQDRRPRRITAIADTRFADFALDAKRERLIAVAETHPRDNDALKVRNILCAVPLGQDEPVNAVKILDGRFDFYASPRINPSGDRLAFLAWTLPSMPWDAATLYCASIDAGGNLIEAESADVAPSPKAASPTAFQPEWDKGGDLFCVFDSGGFGDLYRLSFDGAPPTQMTNDGDLAQPLWSLNASSYAFADDKTIYFRNVVEGEERASIYDRSNGLTKPVRSPITATASVSAENGLIACVGMADDEPLFVASQTLATSTREPPQDSAFQIIRRSSAITLDRGHMPEPRRIAFPNADGGQTYGLFYGPSNPEYAAESAHTPLIINLHGGPTTHASRGLKLRTAYFTSRGFSWLDLNYAGSTGYGRDYRRRLDGRWGVADVADTLAAAKYVSETGLADAAGLFVTGGSAGGYTVMMTIAASNVFRGATSYYGICDLAQLQRTTHKFEHGYLETLLGASLDADPSLYAARSPLTHADRIETPLLLFQGADDRVVSRDQAMMIARAIKKNGGSVEYHEFEGEGHGFRRSETIRRTLDFELAFYQRLLLAHETAP